MGDVGMHHPPEPFDRVEMGAIGRDEVQRDPMAVARQPFAHEVGVMVTGVVKEDVDRPAILNGSMRVAFFGFRELGFLILMSVFKELGVAFGSLYSGEGIGAAHCRTRRH